MRPLPGYEIGESLHEGAFALVARGRDLGTSRSVILKSLRDPNDHQRRARLQHEYNLLADLRAPRIVAAHALIENELDLALVEEDIGGLPLSRFIAQGPCPLASFFGIALQLTDAVQEVHRCNIIHRDINPSNVVFNRATGKLQLIDFGLASRLSNEHPELVPPERIQGTLPYLAPEQSGRMNRTVDFRADFYALGVTFYELLVGARPFVARDALEWVDCHIARVPPVPSEVSPAVPQALSDIVLKLLTKEAEDRYQSAAGIRHDLEECLRQWRFKGAIDPFVLGANDISDRFRLPQRLYGREEELAALAGAFERVAASGCPEFVLVAGHAGVGKSALVAELHRPVIARRGNFFCAKFDQYRRGTPYAALVDALSELVEQVLSEPKERLEFWRPDHGFRRRKRTGCGRSYSPVANRDRRAIARAGTTTGSGQATIAALGTTLRRRIRHDGTTPRPIS